MNASQEPWSRWIAVSAAVALIASVAIGSPIHEAAKSVVLLAPDLSAPAAAGAARGLRWGRPSARPVAATGVLVTLPTGRTVVLASSRAMNVPEPFALGFRRDGKLWQTPAALIGRDASMDLFAASTEAPPGKPVTLSDTVRPQVGDKLYLVAVGCDGRLHLTEGMINETDIHQLGVLRYERLTRVSCPEYVRGGSAAFDRDGRLFGFVVHNAVSRGPWRYTNAYVNPVGAWTPTVERLCEDGAIVRPWAGLVVLQYRDEKGEKAGAVVRRVLPHSPAHRAEVDVNDVIHGYERDGAPQAVLCVTDFTFSIADMAPGATLRLHVRRNGGDVVLPITLDVMPEDYAGRKVQAAPIASGVPVTTSLAPVAPMTRTFTTRTSSFHVQGALGAVAPMLASVLGKPVSLDADVDPAARISLDVQPAEAAAIEKALAEALKASGLEAEITDQAILVHKEK